METPAEGDVAGVEDSILPMSLVQNELTDRESMALQQLYQDAAHAYWVERIGQSDAVPQATDLETATQLGVQGCWTRGLLVQVRCALHKLDLATPAMLDEVAHAQRSLVRPEDCTKMPCMSSQMSELYCEDESPIVHSRRGQLLARLCTQPKVAVAENLVRPRACRHLRLVRSILHVQ